jgi:hypothetical protein
VKQNKASEENSPGTEWLLLGQLVLSIDLISGESIDNWLLKIVGPFHLPPDLYSKLKASVKETVSRSHQFSSDYAYFPSVSIYASDDIKTDLLSNRYWGFFRLEKVGTVSDEGTPEEYVIEYYLYLEK